jgi:hypothetical protein
MVVRRHRNRSTVARLSIAAAVVAAFTVVTTTQASAVPTPQGCGRGFVQFHYTEFDDESALALDSYPTLAAAGGDTEVFVWGNFIEKAGATAYLEGLDRTGNGVLCVKWLWGDQPGTARSQQVYNPLGFDPAYIFILVDDVAAA